MITIHGRPNSINVQKAMWAVGEIGLAHERLDVGGPFGGNDTPEYRAMNPNGLVPVLVDGDTVIWESHTIVRYLGALHDVGGLWPEDPAERTLADRWMDWATASLQPQMTPVFWGVVRTPGSRARHGRDPARRCRAAIDLGNSRRASRGPRLRCGRPPHHGRYSGGRLLLSLYPLACHRTRKPAQLRRLGSPGSTSARPLPNMSPAFR